MPRQGQAQVPGITWPEIPHESLCMTMGQSSHCPLCPGHPAILPSLVAKGREGGPWSRSTSWSHYERWQKDSQPLHDRSLLQLRGSWVPRRRMPCSHHVLGQQRPCPQRPARPGRSGTRWHPDTSFSEEEQGTQPPAQSREGKGGPPPSLCLAPKPRADPAQGGHLAGGARALRRPFQPELAQTGPAGGQMQSWESSRG